MVYITCNKSVSRLFYMKQFKLLIVVAACIYASFMLLIAWYLLQRTHPTLVKSNRWIKPPRFFRETANSAIVNDNWDDDKPYLYDDDDDATILGGEVDEDKEVVRIEEEGIKVSKGNEELEENDGEEGKKEDGEKGEKEKEEEEEEEEKEEEKEEEDDDDDDDEEEENEEEEEEEEEEEGRGGGGGQGGGGQGRGKGGPSTAQARGGSGGETGKMQGTVPPSMNYSASVPVPGYFMLDSHKPFTKRCSRCALVSSAGHLYKSAAGTEIDDADCVLRMNTAPVTGWTNDVGSRTDIRIIGHRNLPRGLAREKSLRSEILLSKKTRAKFIVVPWLFRERVNTTTNRVFRLARSFKKRYPMVDFIFLTSEKHEESEARFRIETGFTRTEMRTWFSTGYVSMMFALDICNEVRVYGMSTLDFCTKASHSDVPYHYYEPKGITECAFQRKHEMGLSRGHKFMTERTMFARWSLVYNITFHHPSWKATIKNATADIDTPFLRKYRASLKKKQPHNASEEEIPRYIIKDGIRYRVVRKIVHKKLPAVQIDTSAMHLNQSEGDFLNNSSKKANSHAETKVQFTQEVKEGENKKAVEVPQPQRGQVEQHLPSRKRVKRVIHRRVVKQKED